MADELSRAINNSPELLSFLNDIRWEFGDSRLLWVKVGEEEFGDRRTPDFAVDLLAEFEQREQQDRNDKLREDIIKQESNRARKSKATRRR